MERRSKPYREDLEPVILYREDIERIIEILKEVSPHVFMSTDEYEFSNTNEWLDLKKDFFTDMELRVTKPYVTVKLTNHDATLFATEDTLQSRGAVDKIRELLKEKAGPCSFLTKGASFQAVGAAEGGSMTLLAGSLLLQNWLAAGICGDLTPKRWT